jgi:hypothetical protein
MINEYSANGFNSGSFLSSKDVLTLDELHSLAHDAFLIKENFVDYCGDQPFFNYCVDIKRLNTKTFPEFIPDLGPSCWANFEPIKLSRGTYQLYGKRMLFIHWAGFKLESYIPNRRIFLHYRLKSESWALRLKYHFYYWLKGFKYNLYYWLRKIKYRFYNRNA